MFFSLDFTFPTHVRRYTFKLLGVKNDSIYDMILELSIVQHEDSIERPHLKDCPRIVEYCSAEIFYAKFDDLLEVFVLDPPFCDGSILIESEKMRPLIRLQ